ncbi:MAG: hypothetical protein ISR91_07195 [Candidatus Delongbacteria bacterium]|nr:hypothetical protein [Candidatus Delongbacteria bacterium]
MKIKSVQANNRRRLFEIELRGRSLTFPYARLPVTPTKENPVEKVWVDPDLGDEAFTFKLRDGVEESVHIDHVLEFNRDPQYVAELLLYKLSLEARKRVDSSGMSNREVIRRLGTSASQYYRLLDPSNTKKSVGQLLGLLQLLGCEVDIIVKDAGVKKKHNVVVSG